MSALQKIKLSGTRRVDYIDREQSKIAAVDNGGDYIGSYYRNQRAPPRWAIVSFGLYVFCSDPLKCFKKN
jgi:hypothetical protein